MAAPGVMDQPDQGGEGDDFTDDDGGSDDLAEEASVAMMESPAPAESPFEPPSTFEPRPTFEPPPSPPEEPVQHVTHSEVGHEPPAPSEIASTPDPVATSEPFDPLTREQS
jgi:hypothetical protein